MEEVRHCSSPAELQLSATKCGNDKEQSGSSSDSHSRHCSHTSSHVRRLLHTRTWQTFTGKKVAIYYQFIYGRIAKYAILLHLVSLHERSISLSSLLSTQERQGANLINLCQILILLHLVIANTLVSHSFRNSFVHG